MQYINFNGNIFTENEPLLPVTNRGIKYGDGFFESMLMIDKKIPLLSLHWDRIMLTAEALSATLPKRFSIELLLEKIIDLASVNEAVHNARVRLQLYRKGSGQYLPEQDELGYIITMDTITCKQFECGDGLTVGAQENCFKAVYNISDLKSSNALPYIIFSKVAALNNWHEMILMNSYGHVCEAIHSNIFVVHGSSIATPDLDSACVNGVMRTCLITLLNKDVEERVIEGNELLEADEIILTNAVKGIQWVKTFAGKQYSNNRAQELTTLLNQKVLEII